MARKLILLNGMTPGGRVFKRLLPLIDHYQLVEWIDPGEDRSISEYAERLQNFLGNVGDCDILGVSFGGIVAQELAPLIGAKNCFIVSSIADAKELNSLHKLLGKLPYHLNENFLSLAGSSSGLIANIGSAPSIRFTNFVGEEGQWFRWATSAVLGWTPKRDHSIRYIRIHGDVDETFKKGHLYSDHVIKGATHVLALTHAEKLAEVLSKYRYENEQINRVS